MSTTKWQNIAGSKNSLISGELVATWTMMNGLKRLKLWILWFLKKDSKSILNISTLTGTIHQCNFGAEEMKSGGSKLKFCINIVIEIEIESVLFCNNWLLLEIKQHTYKLLFSASRGLIKCSDRWCFLFSLEF